MEILKVYVGPTAPNVIVWANVFADAQTLMDPGHLLNFVNLNLTRILTQMNPILLTNCLRSTIQYLGRKLKNRKWQRLPMMPMLTTTTPFDPEVIRRTCVANGFLDQVTMAQDVEYYLIPSIHSTIKA